jgi:hypothetical protein
VRKRTAPAIIYAFRRLFLCRDPGRFAEALYGRREVAALDPARELNGIAAAHMALIALPPLTAALAGRVNVEPVFAAAARTRTGPFMSRPAFQCRVAASQGIKVDCVPDVPDVQVLAHRCNSVPRTREHG